MDNDFDFDAIQEKLNTGTSDKQVSESEEEDKGSDEEFRLDEDELYMEDAPEEKGAEEEAEETEEVDEGDEEETEETEEETSEEKADEEDPYAKIREDILAIVGEDAVAKVKGKEYAIKDLDQQELIKYVQKGIRADQLMQEAAGMRRQLETERELVERGAAAVRQLLAQQEQTGVQPGKKTTDDVSLPPQLKPTEFDSDEVRALKEVSADLYKQVQTLQKGVQESQAEGYANQLLSEIKELKKEYPVAVVDEVLAAKSQYPDASLEALMEASNRYYSSLEFIKTALESNPQAKRELEEQAIKNYRAKLEKNKRAPQRRSRTSASKKVSVKERLRPGISYDFDTAEDFARSYINEVERLHEEV
ncbi:MAG: hypothetical protein JRI45_06850 [Deltaproteobacteria bacterium]|nr:hypothetical protein [Deltaproteobacteria bacterium]